MDLLPERTHGRYLGQSLRQSAEWRLTGDFLWRKRATVAWIVLLSLAPRIPLCYIMVIGAPYLFLDVVANPLSTAVRAMEGLPIPRATRARAVWIQLVLLFPCVYILLQSFWICVWRDPVSIQIFQLLNATALDFAAAAVIFVLYRWFGSAGKAIFVISPIAICILIRLFPSPAVQTAVRTLVYGCGFGTFLPDSLSKSPSYHPAVLLLVMTCASSLALCVSYRSIDAFGSKLIYRPRIRHRSAPRMASVSIVFARKPRHVGLHALRKAVAFGLVVSASSTFVWSTLGWIAPKNVPFDLMLLFGWAIVISVNGTNNWVTHPRVMRSLPLSRSRLAAYMLAFPTASMSLSCIAFSVMAMYLRPSMPILYVLGYSVAAIGLGYVAYALAIVFGPRASLGVAGAMVVVAITIEAHSLGTLSSAAPEPLQSLSVGLGVGTMLSILGLWLFCDLLGESSAVYARKQDEFRGELRDLIGNRTE